MTFNSSNEIHHRFPPASGGVDTTFEDEFDLLLEQSSLGTPNVRAIQALSNLDLIERVQNRIEQDPGSAGTVQPEGDVDDLLLDLVRCATVPDERDDRREGMCESTRRWSVPLKVSFLAQGCESRSTVVAMVAWLAEANVFEHVRRDVARSMLDMAFRSECAPNTVLILLLHSALPRSGVLDELTGRRPRPALTDWVDRPEQRELPMTIFPAVNTCPGVDQTVRDQSDEQGWAIRQDALGALSPHEIWTRIGTGRPDTRLVGPHHMLDDLVTAIAYFAVRWYGPAPGTQPKSLEGRCCGETSVVTPLAGALLGLMHEGAQSSSVLASSVHQRFKMPSVTYARVCDALRILREGGLIHPTSRARTTRRYELTALGKKAFRQWLLVEPGPDRGGVVLGLLSTTSFTSEQEGELIVLSKVLQIDEDQACALTKWMAETLVPIGTTCRRILMNLISTGR